MERENGTDASYRARSKTRRQPAEWFSSSKYKIVLAISAVVILVLIVLFIHVLASGGDAHRTESYKKVSGDAAGLHASITYDCKENCKQAFDFSVYMLTESGDQVAVVRPNQQGEVQIALPAGTYVMLVGKEFGKGQVFPQERLVLKDGQELDLKLHY